MKIKFWIYLLGAAFFCVACGIRPSAVDTTLSNTNPEGGEVPSGWDAGNGGISVKCRWENFYIIQLLDFYEGHLNGIELDDFYSPAITTPEEALGKVTQNLEKVDAVRASRYKTQIEEFRNETEFVHERLKFTEDLGKPLPAECEARQVAVQRKPTSESKIRYRIDLEEWRYLGLVNRAGLLLHEIVYREALELGHKDSRKTRQFVALLMSDKFHKLSQEEYRLREKRARLLLNSA